MCGSISSRALFLVLAACVGSTLLGGMTAGVGGGARLVLFGAQVLLALAAVVILAVSAQRRSRSSHDA